MDEFRCHIRRVGSNSDIVVIDLVGGVFVSNLRTFKEMLDLVEDRRDSSVILNFTELNFISSPAIGAILEAHGRLNRRGGRMIIVGVSQEINNILQFLAFHKLIEIMDNEQAAVDRILSN